MALFVCVAIMWDRYHRLSTDLAAELFMSSSCLQKTQINSTYDVGCPFVFLCCAVFEDAPTTQRSAFKSMIERVAFKQLTERRTKEFLFLCRLSMGFFSTTITNNHSYQQSQVCNCRLHMLSGFFVKGHVLVFFQTPTTRLRRSQNFVRTSEL